MNIKVSVLIAARNEENNIDYCLSALINQDTSFDFEILVGNDNSSDLTGDKVSHWASKYSNISLYSITTKISNLEGKANVLAQLAKQAKGEYLLFTDADTAVNRYWISSMVSSLENFDMVAGVTITGGEQFFSRIQKADFISLFSIASQFNNLNLPTSACGNNMGIKTDVYNQVGTFENIPFSIIEDYALSKAVKKNGFQLKYLFSKNEIAVVKPIITSKEYFQQRIRWMKGSLELPFFMTVSVFLRCLLLPFFILLSGYYFENTVLFFGFLWIVNILSLLKAYKKLDLKFDLEIVCYFPINLVLTFATICNYLVSKKIIWKDRVYAKKTSK
ncbi:MAG: glycosyltransferase [Sediminibacterium sp.]|nr:glycosyltransferase [Sediminibacterium sp.]